MGIRFACHACQKPLHIKSELAGRRGVCPQCRTRFRIPNDDAEFSIPIEENGSAPVETAAAVATAPQVAEASAADQAELSPAVPSEAKTGSTAAAESERPAAHSAPSLLDDPTAVWYVRPPSGGQYGPATGDVLRSWIGESRVTSTSLVWRDGWPQWRTAAESLTEFGASPEATATTKPAMWSGTLAVTEPAPALTGDAKVGTRKSKVANQRLLTVTLLAGISILLVGVLIFLTQR